MKKKRQDVFYQAQAILSRRDHSVAEVKAKLRRKGFTEEEGAKAVAFLQEQNLLDDARFARAYVNSLLASKPVGPRYLSAKLKQKGIAESIINETLLGLPAEASGEGRGVKQAAEQWKKLHPKYADDKNRLFRFLASRGFTPDAVSAIMGTYE